MWHCNIVIFLWFSYHSSISPFEGEEFSLIKTYFKSKQIPTFHWYGNNWKCLQHETVSCVLALINLGRIWKQHLFNLKKIIKSVKNQALFIMRSKQNKNKDYKYKMKKIPSAFIYMFCFPPELKATCILLSSSDFFPTASQSWSEKHWLVKCHSLSFISWEWTRNMLFMGLTTIWHYLSEVKIIKHRNRWQCC